MSSLTARLKLIVNTAADPFEIDDLTNNSNILDASPGVFICTSSTRPSTWGTNQTGMAIWETDTKLLWHWDGTAWQRYVPKGWLNTQQITSDVSTSLTTYQVAVSTPVTVAAGGRRHEISVSAPRVFNSLGLTQLAIFRDANLLTEWFSQGSTGAPADTYPRGSSPTVYDVPGVGARTYTLQYRAVSGIGGTSTVGATAANPASLTVLEV